MSVGDGAAFLWDMQTGKQVVKVRDTVTVSWGKNEETVFSSEFHRVLQVPPPPALAQGYKVSKVWLNLRCFSSHCGILSHTVVRKNAEKACQTKRSALSRSATVQRAGEKSETSECGRGAVMGGEQPGWKRKG